MKMCRSKFGTRVDGIGFAWEHFPIWNLWSCVSGWKRKSQSSQACDDLRLRRSNSDMTPCWGLLTHFLMPCGYLPNYKGFLFCPKYWSCRIHQWEQQWSRELCLVLSLARTGNLVPSLISCPHRDGATWTIPAVLHTVLRLLSSGSVCCLLTSKAETSLYVPSPASLLYIQD